MICRRCQTSNPDSSVYCSGCSAPLIRGPAAKGNKFPKYLIPLAAIGLLAGSYFLYTLLSRPPSAETTRGTETVSEQTAPAATADHNAFLPAAGEVIVHDSLGAEVFRSAVPVVDGFWIALPTWTILGGGNLEFQGQDSGSIPIKEGTWTSGSALVLWKLETDKELSALELFPWKRNTPLEWHALSLKTESSQVEIGSPPARGPLASFLLPEELREPGIFMQESRLVGWAFGEGMDTGYLWIGTPGADLRPNIQVDQFYDSIVSNSREAYFSRALALGEASPAAVKLGIFAEGFQRLSLLADEDLPPQLKIHSIAAKMHSLASHMIQRGQAKDVPLILDDRVLAEAADPELLKDAVLAVAKDRDYNRAIQYLERTRKTISAAGVQNLAGIEEFHARLFKDWLREIIEKGGYFSGAVAYEEAKRAFPDDVDIHLLGVEIALTEKNWERAKAQLRVRNYPPEWQARVNELESRIKEQEDEEAVIIRFNPGDGLIRVEASLNGIHRQEFIVDTGANITSIPFSAVEALRIKLDDSTRVTTVRTASGVGLAYEVILDSIDLEGLLVKNLSVIILNLPGERDVGVLGLNFFKNFRYEIDNSKGILRLKKK